jgi:FAD/FMN-containing dehydrogenase
VFPANADEVAQAVKIGADNGLKVAARSGGVSRPYSATLVSLSHVVL